MSTLQSVRTVRTLMGMADDKRLELRVSEEWLGTLDRARGDVPRATFVKDAVRRRASQVLKAGERRRPPLVSPDQSSNGEA